jgi:hypothetical protein
MAEPERPHAELERAAYSVLQKFAHNTAFSPLAMMSLKASWESAIFAEQHLATARTFFNAIELRNHVVELALPDGLFCEFGVFKGASMRGFASKFAAMKQQRMLYGFDSFEGFSEEWTGSPVGKRQFDVRGALPDVPSNVELIVGFVEDTYEKFLARPGIAQQRVAVLHIDTDTFSPAKVVLTLSRPRFEVGTVILFDEFYGYPGWKQHEYRALMETAAEFGFEYEFIGFSHRSAAIRITRP